MTDITGDPAYRATARAIAQAREKRLAEALADIARLRERAEILEAELRVTKKIAMQNVSEQAAEIAGLRTKLAREVLKGMDEIVARLRREKEALGEAALVLADDLESDYPQEHGGGAHDADCPLCRAIKVIRSATETKDRADG